jgi:peptide/nickel transport system substrate-binding protein
VKTDWGSQYSGKVKVIDPHTVCFKTPEPDPLLPSRLGPMSISIAPLSITALTTALTDSFVMASELAVGTGPSRIVEPVVGDHMTFECRDDYWAEKRRPYRIIIQIIRDAQTRVAALERGEIDVAINLPVRLVPSVESQANLTVYGVLGSTTHAMAINVMKGGALAHEKVCQALHYAVDKEAILKALYDGRGKVLGSIAAQQIMAWTYYQPIPGNA